MRRLLDTGSMQSKISRRLAQGTSLEVSANVYAPRLARDFPACFTHLCDINQAHLLMLRETGLLSGNVAKQLAQALLDIEAAGVSVVPLDPALEDAYFNYEAHLMRRAGAHVGGCLHVARSRNDILATMDKLRARQSVLDLKERLCITQMTALQKAHEYADVVMPGYTHLQPAQPITNGFWLLAVADLLGRDIARLRQLHEELDLCPLGAGALAGTTFTIDRARTASLLGFGGAVPNALDAVASRDYALELLSVLAIMSTGASRVAQDYYVWVTPEFDLIDFPDSVAGTSSIMPQKKNPVVLEYLKGKAGHINGLLMAALGTVKGVHFTHTGDGNRESMRSVWEACDESLRVLNMLELVLRTATPKKERMLARARVDFGTATDLADTLVRNCGLSFRESHHVVGAAVRAAIGEGMGAAQITPAMLDQAAVNELGRPLSLSEDAVRESLDPQISVARRRLVGGPQTDTVRQRCDWLIAKAGEEAAQDNVRKEHFALSRIGLKQAVTALASQVF